MTRELSRSDRALLTPGYATGLVGRPDEPNDSTLAARATAPSDQRSPSAEESDTCMRARCEAVYRLLAGAR